MQAPLITHERFAPNNDGWLLHLTRSYCPEKLQTHYRPLAIVPGYGMNAFIFGFHPRGTSMVRTLAEQGFEVWSLNLRKQGDSRPTSGSAPGSSLRALAEVDLTAAIETILADTRTLTEHVDVIGCSLGGAIAYAHLVLRPQNRVGSLVTVGTPLRWVERHPVFRLAFASPAIAGLLRFNGTRAFARAAFPILAKAPGLLNIYMNTSHVDIAAAGELTRTVEDPIPRLNKDISLWMQHRDLILRGVNITEGLRDVDIPLLVAISNRDGIVPEATALSVVDAWGGKDITTMTIGDDEEWFAHADLFIANSSPEKVFRPIGQWLIERNGEPRRTG